MVPSKELIAASTRPLLLSLLAEGDSYGYALIQRVKELSGGKLLWSEGMLYPVLHRMEKDGLIRSEWRDSEVGRRRKYYKLTSDGGHAAHEERAEWLLVHHTLAKLWHTASAKA
ncbi:MAG: PadR family transcriptional regulator [Verrucomicrobiaceae bacterium]|nr:MAG: PadR family transcriptional regulator [Verrucomicrobiaceae bacterium]